MWRNLLDIGLDAALIGATIEYAEWLAEHKALEPDWTWLEVAAGTTLCLAHATAGGLLYGGGWRDQQLRVIRSFAFGATPVVLGELRQWRARQAERRRYEASRA
jgi:hypothetical protein